MKIKILFSLFLLISLIVPAMGTNPGLCSAINKGTTNRDNQPGFISGYVENNTSATSLLPCTLSITLSSTPYYCTSSYAGSATVMPSGGTPPYSYEWLPGGQSIPTITGLSLGTYSVTVTDSAGCTATGSVIISTGTVTAIATPSTVTAGDSTLLTAICGITASYSWLPAAYVTNPNSQNTYAHPPVTTVFTVMATTACGILVSTVTVNVTGCTFIDSILKSSYYCPSLAGSIRLVPIGGTPPYTYLWAPGGQTTSTLTGLSAGGYDVIITDAAGCNLTNAISIPSGSISYSLSGNPLFINPGDSVLLSASCSIPADFSWTPAASVTNPDSSDTYAHPTTTTDYTVSITTACGTFTNEVLISINCFSLALNSSPSFSCSSSYDGAASVVPSGGILPYTYSWSPGGGTTAEISNLAPGTYTITVHDNSGCEAVGMVTVGIKTPTLVATATPSVVIAGDSTYLSATCSSAASYSWSPATYVTSPTSQNTYAHPPSTMEFTVIAITDTCGDELLAYDTVVVTGCTFHDNITKTPYYCSSLEGSITVSPYGGILPYTYLWSPGGQTTATISGLSAGGYDVTITDANGCNLTNAITVSTSPITYSVTGNPSYILAGDSALLTATCNIPATYSWTPAASVTHPASASTYAHPSATTEYTVTITTACGTYIDSVLINIPCFPLNMSSTVSYPCSSSSSYDGTATVSPGGGTPPYTYLWSPGGQTTATITGLDPGTYTVTVYDATGCSATGEVSLSSVSAMFTISANPLYILNGDSALLVATSNVPATFSWSPSTSVTYPDSATTYAHPSISTVYTVTITTLCGTNTYTVLITVNCFNMSAISTPAYCSDYDDTAVAIPLGGTPPYTYLWLPGGQTTDTVMGLEAGTYSLTIYDFTGCGSTVSVVVTSASGLPPFSSTATPHSIPPGDSSYLSAISSIPATYVWAPTTGLTDPTSQNTYAHPAVTTIYTVSALTICGTLTSYDTVFVNPCINLFDEPICVVTVDTATNKCEVIWGRTNSPPAGGFGSYLIYKDSMGGYELTHSQAVNVLSDYIDLLSNPSAGPVSYELSTADSCGESATSAVHTSVYLTVAAGTNAYILNWTAYVGFIPSKYRIFRGVSMNSLVQIDSVLSTTLMYRDTSPPPSSIYLIQAVNPTGACVPTTHRPAISSLDVPSGSLSNIVPVSILGIQPVATSSLNLNIYPNPGNGIFTVRVSIFSNPWQLEIYNELGENVFSLNNGCATVINNQLQMNLSNLASGIYTLRFQTDNITEVRKIEIIKNK